MSIRFLAAGFLILATGCQSTPPAKDAEATGAMVATAHPRATDIAVGVLESGGNAADAAVAAGFALAVTEPAMSHLGGRIQILVRSPDGHFHGYDGMTEVPGDYVAPEEPLSQGYGTIATPGMVAGLARLHEEHGAIAWSDLLQEPARVARDGYELLPRAADRHANGLDNFGDNPGFQQVFIEADGTAYDAGDVIRQPVLADTILRIAEQGAEDFYHGETAQLIAADMTANGGFVTAEDLAAYEVLDGRYITTSYRGYDIHSLAAPAGGGLVIKSLNILENFELALMTDTQWAAVVNQALALTFNSMADDPDEADLAQVADKGWAAKQAALIDVPPAIVLTTKLQPVAEPQYRLPDRRRQVVGSLPEEPHHTSHFTIADCDGRVVSITQTIGPSFGSRVITPGLGFVYATTMGTYLRAQDQAPGSRPRTTIAPTVVTRDGEVVMALGAAGGVRILSAIVQTISRHLDQGYDPVTAVALPRVHPMREETDSGERVVRTYKMEFEMTPERGWSTDVADELAAARFEIVPETEHAKFGRVHLVARQGNTWQGVADFDWDGTAAPANCPAR